MEDLFSLKIIEMNRKGDTTRILNALRDDEFYDGDPEKPAHYKPEDLMKIRGLNIKSVAVIARALESMGVILDAEE